jgi:hypothetical protein
VRVDCIHVRTGEVSGKTEEAFHPLSLSSNTFLSQAKEPFMAKHMRTFSARTHFSECGLLMAPVFFYFACYHHHFPPSRWLRERAVCVAHKPLFSFLCVSLSLSLSRRTK